MKPNYPAGEAAAEARAPAPGQRARDLPAAMAEGARRAGPSVGRLPLTHTPLPRQQREES
jgi:hypothetical protein